MKDQDGNEIAWSPNRRGAVQYISRVVCGMGGCVQVTFPPPYDARVFLAKQGWEFVRRPKDGGKFQAGVPILGWICPKHSRERTAGG